MVQTPVWLVLCSLSDEGGLWAFEHLRARGLGPVELVTSDALAYAAWEHGIDGKGAQVLVTLNDGRKLQSDQIAGTLNRLVWLPAESFMLIHPDERDYVTQELNAFYVSWLNTLPEPMLNRPTTQSLCGRIHHISEWISLAAKAGLPIPRYRQSSRSLPPEYALHARVPDAPSDLGTVLVVGSRALGSQVPDPIAEGCVRLSELAQAPMLGVDFSIGPRGTWTFAGATTFPDLIAGGEPLLDALAAELTNHHGGPQ